MESLKSIRLSGRFELFPKLYEFHYKCAKLKKNVLFWILDNDLRCLRTNYVYLDEGFDSI